MKAYLMHNMDGMWMVFGDNALKASEMLPSGVDQRQVSVSGQWELDEPIDLYRLWPFFTNNPTHTESPT